MFLIGLVSGNKNEFEMTEYKEFMVFEIEESGDRNQIDIDQEELSFHLNSEKAFVIVREDVRRIYLWKGARAPVRKRFHGSRFATTVQGELMKNGYHRCKVISIDQGDELKEFLNIFGLNSMEVLEPLEDKRYTLNTQRERLKQEEVFSTRVESLKSTKLDEIKSHLDDHERILWIKSTSMKISKDWIANALKNKKFKSRLKKIRKSEELELKPFEKREVLTDKKILVYNKINKLLDFSGVHERNFSLEGDIAILNIEGLDSLDVTKSNELYNVWFNAEPSQKGDCLFLFEALTQEEYNKLIDIFSVALHFRAEIPKEVGTLRYSRKKQ